MWLIVGLGNPGAEYAQTRHNFGFLLLDKLAEIYGAQIKRKDCRALLGRAVIDGTAVELVKPQTYMNLSGEVVGCLTGKTGVKPERILVISDDLALPFGKLRLRRDGSAGGHNGLKSLIAVLKSDAFVRLRIGIQPAHQLAGNTKNFVLERFSQDERAELDNVLERGAKAVRVVITDGIDKAMLQFN